MFFYLPLNSSLKKTFTLKISFSALGCADILPQEATWVQRNGNVTTLGCRGGTHSWTLKCENNHWIGAVGSCRTGMCSHILKYMYVFMSICHYLKAELLTAAHKKVHITSI